MAMPRRISRRCATARRCSARRASCTSSARRKRSTSRWCSPSARWLAGWRRPRAPSTWRSAPCSVPTRRCSRPRAAKRCASSDLLDEAVERADAELSRASPSCDAATRARARRADRHRRRSSTRISRTTASRTTCSTGTACSRPRVARGRICNTHTRGSTRSSAGPRSGGVARAADAAISARRAGRAQARARAARFRSAVLEAGETLRPHRLCGLSVRSRDGVHGVLRELPRAEGARRCDARVAARARASSRRACWRAGLGLLGIAAPERM